MQDWLLFVVKLAALTRSAWLVVGIFRMVPVHMRARTRRWGWIEVMNLVELPVFLGLTALLVLRPPAVPGSGSAALVAAAIGAVAAVCGVVVSIWAIATTVRRGVILDAGHFVKKEHPLITTGAYGFVRNPMYLGILLLWLGIAIAYENVWLLAATLVYVAPAVWLYIRAEEGMMAEEFGDQFVEYTRRVGRLLPRRHARAA